MTTLNSKDMVLADKYQQKTDKQHILDAPDTYIGSIEPQKITNYIYDDTTKKMVIDELTYIPGLLKIFDEVIVNAIDHVVDNQFLEIDIPYTN